MALYYFCMVYHMFCAISPATFRYSNGPMSHKASVIRLQLIWSTSPTGLLLYILVITVLNNNVSLMVCVALRSVAIFHAGYSYYVLISSACCVKWYYYY